MLDDTDFVKQLRALELQCVGKELAAHADVAAAVRQRLAQVRATETDVEYAVDVPDPAAQRVLLALCRRYGLDIYRRPRQRKGSVCVRAPRTFGQDLLWPVFKPIARATEQHVARNLERSLAVAFEVDMSPDPDAP